VTTLSPARLELSQSATGSQSGSAVLTVANAFDARIVTATQAGNGNSLVLSLSQARIQGNGYSVITVTTKNGAGNRGEFEVDLGLTPACGTGQKLIVKVSN